MCLEEGLSDQQMGELKSWLAADEAHRAALIRMAEQWDSFDALSELAEILPLRTESARTNRFAMAGVALVAVAVGALAVSLHFAFLRSASPGAAPASPQIAANRPAPRSLTRRRCHLLCSAACEPTSAST